MPIKSERINLSVPPSRLKKIIEVGRENQLQSRDGSLQKTPICTAIVFFILDVHSDPEVRAYLKRNGGTLLDLIRRALKRYVSN